MQTHHKMLSFLFLATDALPFWLSTMVINNDHFSCFVDTRFLCFHDDQININNIWMIDLLIWLQKSSFCFQYEYNEFLFDLRNWEKIHALSNIKFYEMHNICIMRSIILKFFDFFFEIFYKVKYQSMKYFTVLRLAIYPLMLPFDWSLIFRLKWKKRTIQLQRIEIVD